MEDNRNVHPEPRRRQRGARHHAPRSRHDLARLELLFAAGLLEPVAWRIHARDLLEQQHLERRLELVLDVLRALDREVNAA